MLRNTSYHSTHGAKTKIFFFFFIKSTKFNKPTILTYVKSRNIGKILKDKRLSKEFQPDIDKLSVDQKASVSLVHEIPNGSLNSVSKRSRTMNCQYVETLPKRRTAKS